MKNRKIESGNKLRGLEVNAEDVCYFEQTLNHAMQSVYQFQEGGNDNYGGGSPLIGKIELVRFDNHLPGDANIMYTPSHKFVLRWGYDRKKIGAVNLKDKTYFVEWKSPLREDTHEIPLVLMKDTESVMKFLGLRKKK